MTTDVSGLDPLSVSLRDYIDEKQVRLDRETVYHAERHQEQHNAHRHVHDLEKEAITTLAALVAAQRTEDAKSVEVALEAVQRAAQIHAVAHEQQHAAHQAIHDVEKEAIVKATEQLDKRLYAMNEYRAQLRDQSATFVNVDVYNTKMVALEHERDDFRETQIAVTTRLTSLEVGLATKSQAGDTSNRTTMAVIGFTITIVIAIVVILTNVLTATP